MSLLLLKEGGSEHQAALRITFVGAIATGALLFSLPVLILSSPFLALGSLLIGASFTEIKTDKELREIKKYLQKRHDELENREISDHQGVAQLNAEELEKSKKTSLFVNA
ncbi:MAG: hypothetical protein HC880_07645 [Bacteroidia bacterium]|nr:hypothetical protein [Bacteroidia bacterium]